MAKIHLGAMVHKDFVEFAVWLPEAQKVILVLDNADFTSQEFIMELHRGDIWLAQVKGATIGMTYQFKVMLKNGDEKLLNDPRARQLTASTNGKSVIADSEFDWGDDTAFMIPPVEKQVIYELHIGTFNQPDQATPGTFATASEKFAHLKDLGVNMLEILPVTSMLGGAGWGYAPINLFAVEENYGGPHGLREFIQAAHQDGFGVIIDIVYNHMHPDADLPEAYFSAGDLRNTPWGPRFDYTKAEVQEYLEDNVALWLNDFHADGLRLDFTLGIRQTDSSFDDLAHEVPGGWQILQKLTSVAHKIKPAARVIAEDNGSNEYLTKKIADGGAGFDAQWDVEMPRLLRGYLAGNNSLADSIRDFEKYYNGDFCGKISFAESHDTAALSNGNRRLTCDFDPATPTSAKAQAMTILAGAMALTVPGTPMLFQGQEMAAADGWSAQDLLDWVKADKAAGIIAAHRHLINLRKNLYGDSWGLASNDFKIIIADEANKILVFQRGPDNEQPVIVVANFNSAKVMNYRLPLPDGSWKVRFNSSWRGYASDFANLEIEQVDTTTKIDLPEYVVMILKQK